MAVNTKRGQPSYISHFLFYLYKHGNLFIDKDETQQKGHQIMRELQTTDSEPKMGQEYFKEEEVVKFSNDERSIIKKLWDIL